MRQTSDAFAQLEEKVTFFLRKLGELNSLRESLEVALADPQGEIAEAAAMLHAAGEAAKINTSIRSACSDFLKHALPEGAKAETPAYTVTHYTRAVFDKCSWEHYAKTDEELRPLWQASEALESAKQAQKDEFQYLDSSVRVTLKREVQA